MFLNIFESIKEFFNKANETSHIDALSSLLIGIIIGFILCVLLYVAIVLTPIKKEERKIIKLNKGNDEVITRIITNAKNQFVEESSTKSTSEKFDDLKNIATNIIHDIAKVYYPNSVHPLYELSADEMLILNHYITDRIDKMFSNILLKKLRKIRISSILKIVDMKKKYDQNKLVKAANKAQVPTILKSVKATLNIANPLYWIKKVMIDTTYTATVNKKALTIIEIIGNETNKVYSRSVFNIEEDQETIKKMLLESEKMQDSKEKQN